MENIKYKISIHQKIKVTFFKYRCLTLWLKALMQKTLCKIRFLEINEKDFSTNILKTSNHIRVHTDTIQYILLIDNIKQHTYNKTHFETSNTYPYTYSFVENIIPFYLLNPIFIILLHVLFLN